MNFKKTVFSIALVLYSVFVLASEQWFEAYDAAMNDIKTQNWLSAETRLKQAFKEHPEQGKKVRAYGARFMRYFPEYYLGVVYFNTGRYQLALQNFLSVQNKDLINQGDAEYQELTSLSGKAMAKLNPQVQPPPSPVPAENKAQVPAAETRKEDSVPPSVPTEVKVEEKKPPAQAVPVPDKSVATTAEDKLTTKINETVIQIRKAWKTNNWDTLEETAATLQLLDPSNPELVKVATRLEQRKAMIAFYSGDFDNSMQLFQKIAATRPDATMHFYLGCNYAALGFYQGKKGESLLAKARQEFSLAKQVGGNPAYDQQFISPRILRLYEQTN